MSETPPRGGSYTRNADGSLSLVERTEEEKATEAATEPTPPTTEPDASKPSRRNPKES